MKSRLSLSALSAAGRLYIGQSAKAFGSASFSILWVIMPTDVICVIFVSVLGLKFPSHLRRSDSYWASIRFGRRTPDRCSTRVDAQIAHPIRKIIGDLSNTEGVLVGLDLQESTPN
jgi:hypothetical protein